MKCRSFTRSSTREYTTLRIFSVITLSILYRGSLSLQTALARENILSRSRECSLLQSRKCTIFGSPSSSPAKHFARTFWFAVVWFILCSAFLKFCTQPSGFENLKQSTLFCFSEQHKCFKTLLYQDTTANTFKNTNIPLSTVNCLSRLSWQTGSIIGHPVHAKLFYRMSDEKCFTYVAYIRQKSELFSTSSVFSMCVCAFEWHLKTNIFLSFHFARATSLPSPSVHYKRPFLIHSFERLYSHMAASFKHGPHSLQWGKTNLQKSKPIPKAISTMRSNFGCSLRSYGCIFRFWSYITGIFNWNHGTYFLLAALRVVFSNRVTTDPGDVFCLV